MFTTKRILAAGGLVTVIVGSGGIVAMATGSTAGTIHACKGKHGALRIAERCKHSEKVVTWSRQGAPTIRNATLGGSDAALPTSSYGQAIGIGLPRGHYAVNWTVTVSNPTGTADPVYCELKNGSTVFGTYGSDDGADSFDTISGNAAITTGTGVSSVEVDCKSVQGDAIYPKTATNVINVTPVLSIQNGE